MSRSLVTTAVSMVGAVVVLLAGSAQADWPHDAFNCKAYRADLIWQAWARKHCPRYRWRRVQQVPYGSGDALCHGVIIATGDQAQSTKVATENAIVAWQGRVRFRFGERYIDINYARGQTGKDPEVVCSQSSVPDALRDKTNPTLYRCELSAAPCRAVPKKLK